MLLYLEEFLDSSSLLRLGRKKACTYRKVQRVPQPPGGTALLLGPAGRNRPSDLRKLWGLCGVSPLVLAIQPGGMDGSFIRGILCRICARKGQDCCRRPSRGIATLLQVVRVHQPGEGKRKSA